MQDFLSIFLRLSRDRHGVTALEYGMMAALIAMAVVVAVTRVGSKALVLWTSVRNMAF